MPAERKLRTNDPRTVGDFRLLLPLDEAQPPPEDATGSPAAPVGSPDGIRRYLARSRTGHHTVTVTTLRPEAADVRGARTWLEREARAAEVVTGPWAVPLVAADLTAQVPWLAHVHTPALSLERVLAVSGPLPEPAVRGLAAVLVDVLARLHAAGLAHTALTDHTVLLAADGPRLTGLGHTTERADPATDVRDLGVLLGRAATGRPHQPGETSAVPEDFGALSTGLAAILRPTLAGIPAERPTAAQLREALGEPVRVDGSVVPLPGPAVVLLTQQAAAVLAAEAPDGEADPEDSPGPRDPEQAAAHPTPAPDAATQQLRTVPSAAAREAPEPPGAPPAHPGRLPGPRDGEVWAPPVPGTARPGPPPVPEPAPRSEPAPHPEAAPDVPGADPDTAQPAPPEAPRRPSRRGLLRGVAAGTGGLLVGAGAVAGWVTGRGTGLDALTHPTGSGPHPSGSPRPGPPPGTPPVARWRHELPGNGMGDTRPLVWRDRMAVLVGEDGTVAVELADGREVWSRTELASIQSPEIIGKDLALVAEAGEWVAFSARTGRKRWSDRRYYQEGKNRSDLVFQTSPGLLPATRDGRTVFFVGRTLRPAGEGAGAPDQQSPGSTEFHLVAFDTEARRERWRAPLPVYYASDVGALPGTRSVVVVGNRGGVPELTSYRLADGRQEWRHLLDGVRDTDRLSFSLQRSTVYATRGGELRAFDYRSGQRLWSRRLVGYDETPLGRAILREVPSNRSGAARNVLFLADTERTLYAIDPDSGAELWRRPLRDDGSSAYLPVLETSSTGRTLYCGTRVEVVALDARTGAPHWRFQEARGVAADPYQIHPAGGAMLVLRGPVAFALPAD